MDWLSLLSLQFFAIAVFLAFMFLTVMRGAFSFNLRNDALAARLARREQEMHDSEHEIHLP